MKKKSRRISGGLTSQRSSRQAVTACALFWLPGAEDELRARWEFWQPRKGRVSPIKRLRRRSEAAHSPRSTPEFVIRGMAPYARILRDVFSWTRFGSVQEVA